MIGSDVDDDDVDGGSVFVDEVDGEDGGEGEGEVDDGSDTEDIDGDSDMREEGSVAMYFENKKELPDNFRRTALKGPPFVM